ncbi:MAG TPA: DegT/DnrJ/EryC1/StrS family aminotransferase [Terrimicrobiaceae bacterium]|nr:DegT/DnrJ/EryC1/StrS family aminotransferase [Terrimicrobiaceae bacterium]
MRVPFNDLAAHHAALQPQLADEIARVIAESAFVRSPDVTAFESAFAKAVGSPRCVSCANGTDALYIAMKGLGVKPGDEVITTAHSWISTSETITQAGAKVVFADTDPDSFTLNPREAEAKITPRTVGIIPVHLYGHPAAMDELMAIAEKHNLWVIEDCAQAHLARSNGRTVGTFGRAATFSFYPGKNLGAIGDAGGLVTEDARLADWAELYARHGGKGNHQIEGINSRLDGLQAAVLNLKLPHLPRWTALRQARAAEYDDLLRGVGDIVTPPVQAGAEHVYHLYVIRTERRDALRKHLAERQIDTVLNYPKALPFYAAYDYLGHRPEEFPVAYRHQDTILSLPIYPEMRSEQTAYVADSIREFFAN